MSDKELYKQKFQAQLDEWKADIEQLKAKSLGAKTDAQLEMNGLIEDIEAKFKTAGDKLGEISDAGESAWESVKAGAESAWESLKSSMHNAAAKFKD